MHFYLSGKPTLSPRLKAIHDKEKLIARYSSVDRELVQQCDSQRK